MSAQNTQFSSYSRYAGRRKPLDQRQAQQLVSQSLGGDGLKTIIIGLTDDIAGVVSSALAGYCICMDITHNDINASIIALRDNRYGGREPLHAQFNSYAGKRPSGGVRDAYDLNRIADGNGALIEGPSIQWFPDASQYVRYRGKHSSSQDNHYVA